MKLKCECQLHTLLVSQWKASGAKWVSLLIEQETKIKKDRYMGDVLLDKEQVKKLLRYLQKRVKP